MKAPVTFTMVSSTNSSSSIKSAAANAAARKLLLKPKKAQDEIFLKQMKMKQLETEVAKGELQLLLLKRKCIDVLKRKKPQSLMKPRRKQDQQEIETPLAQTLLNQNAGSWPQVYPLHPTSKQVEMEAQMQNNVTANQQLIEILLLPKVELSSLLVTLKYWQFVKTFQECAGITSGSTRAKLTRLLQSCTGRAAKAVACCNRMNSEDGYKKALDILQQRFGNELYIKEAWLRKVTEGPYLKDSDKLMSSNIADDLRNCVETFNALGHEPEVVR
nr:uncharacterized protein LOC113817011 [Penaeus vannamei]